MPGKRPTALEGEPEMSDAGVICTWMEPKPTRLGRFGKSRQSPGGWWWFEHNEWHSILEFSDNVRHLGMLHEVEARLTDEQWEAYRIAMCVEWQMLSGAPPLGQFYIHADAPTKIVALAKVLRPIVGGKK